MVSIGPKQQMYLPKVLVEEDRTLVLRLLRENPLANVVTAHPELIVNAAPTMISEVEGQIEIRFHLAQRNTQCDALPDGAQCLLVFTGPNCYVSPSWYAEHPNVPTWNYIAAHAHGSIRVLSESELEQLLRELTHLHEPAVGGTWRYEEMPSDFRQELLAEIRGFCMQVTRLEAKSKLSQNRPLEDRHNVSRHLLESSSASARAVGQWMAEKYGVEPTHDSSTE